MNVFVYYPHILLKICTEIIHNYYFFICKCSRVVLLQFEPPLLTLTSGNRILEYLGPLINNLCCVGLQLQDMETSLNVQTAPQQYPRRQSRPSFSHIPTLNSNRPEEVNSYFGPSTQEGA
jgi:hypothetical protein